MSKKTLKQLVKSECANLISDNYCSLIDMPCKFFNSQTNDEIDISCRYFETSVLPLEPALDLQYRIARKMEPVNTKSKIIKCECGNNFEANSNRQKYCDKCKIKKQRGQGKIKNADNKE